jgi:Uma2 family endonuclease
MTEHTAASPPVSQNPGQVIGPVRVTAEEYMEKYAHDFYEWVDGELEPLSPIHARHNALFRYFLNLLQSYFIFRPIGKIEHEPFVLRLDAVNAYREPDLMVILDSNPGELTDTAMIGPADIVIEIVSPGSVERDYGRKFVEYEKSGVKEYWLFDPVREDARFHRLNEQGLYKAISPDENGHYESPLLPGLKIHVPTLWRETLPDMAQTLEAVRAMLASAPENDGS